MPPLPLPLFFGAQVAWECSSSSAGRGVVGWLCICRLLRLVRRFRSCGSRAHSWIHPGAGRCWPGRCCCQAAAQPAVPHQGQHKCKGGEDLPCAWREVVRRHFYCGVGGRALVLQRERGGGSRLAGSQELGEALSYLVK